MVIPYPAWLPARLLTGENELFSRRREDSGRQTLLWSWKSGDRH